jgi:hypothetical protein
MFTHIVLSYEICHAWQVWVARDVGRTVRSQGSQVISLLKGEQLLPKEVVLALTASVIGATAGWAVLSRFFA